MLLPAEAFLILKLTFAGSSGYAKTFSSEEEKKKEDILVFVRISHKAQLSHTSAVLQANPVEYFAFTQTTQGWHTSESPNHIHCAQLSTVACN